MAVSYTTKHFSHPRIMKIFNNLQDVKYFNYVCLTQLQCLNLGYVKVIYNCMCDKSFCLTRVKLCHYEIQLTVTVVFYCGIAAIICYNLLRATTKLNLYSDAYKVCWAAVKTVYLYEDLLLLMKKLLYNAVIIIQLGHCIIKKKNENI